MRLFFFTISISVLLVIVSKVTQAGELAVITGRVTDAETREPIELVNVLVKGTSIGVATNANGIYVLPNLEPGVYTLVFSAIGYATTELKITVPEAQKIVQNVVLMPSTLQMDEVVVLGASLRAERITDAPAAVSLVDGKDIARNAGSGQLPKLLEMQPGVDMVQNGLNDFNVNTRGFNSSLNRRLLVLLDGRDLGTAFLGATEWNGLSTPLEELGRLELVRGPGSALYGANAYNGVLNITSLPPKSTPGTRIILGGGELSTIRGDIRHAGTSGHLSYRINAGGYQGDSFGQSRLNNAFEYPGLNPFLNTELVAMNTDPIQSIYAAARVDYDYESGGVATIEGGLTSVKNEVIVTGIGRVQVQGAMRPWARLAYSGHGINALFYTNGRINDKPDKSLSTGLDLTQDAFISQGEVQYHASVLDNALSLVGGASYRLVTIDTKGTLMLESRSDNMTGLFAQAEYHFTKDIKLVAAGRYDRSTLHSGQFSPKAAFVYSPFSGHTFRLTYNQAFQSPNYSELFLHVKHPTRPLAYYGNLVTNPPGLNGFQSGIQPGAPKDLVVERITSYEFGYKGIVANSLFFTMDWYYSELKDFITDLAPAVNPKYPVDGLYPGETPDKRTIWSYVNSGAVKQWGIEFSVHYYLNDSWRIDFNGNTFDWEVLEAQQNDVLIPNSPKYKMAGGVTYTDPNGFDVGISMKYVPTFDWAAGIYKGKILAYTLLNLSGSYRIMSNVSINISISNLLDRKHYQIFGGSLLGRRTIVSASYMF